MRIWYKAAAVGVAGLLVGCSLPELQDQAPVSDMAQATVAPVVSWVPGPSGLVVPVSATDGPLEQSPVPHGFTRSPQGAVLAAITAQAWMAGAGDETWPKVAEFLLEPGLGRTQWSQARALVSVDGVITDPARFVGFRFDSYSDDAAVVVLATRWPDGLVAGYPVQLSHAAGSWRVVVPEQDKAPDMQELTEEQLKEFVLFEQEEKR